MRSVTIMSRALFFAAILALPAAASAIELSYCDESEEDCECSPEAAEGYDGCAVGDLGDVTPTNDPLELREALSLEVLGINDETGAVRVRTDVSSFAASVLILNGRRGQWESREELEQYVNLLIYGTPEPELVPFDVCLGGLNIDLSQRGAIARVDPEEGAWTSYQTQNFIYAAISDEQGRVFVEGELIWDFDLLHFPCQTAYDGEFRGTQCSTIELSASSGPSAVCGEQELVPMRSSAVTVLSDFGLETQQNLTGIIPGESVTRFIWRRIIADRAFVHAYYYDGSGHQLGTIKLGDVVDDGHVANNPKPNVSGTCGGGTAHRAGYTITPVTRAGTAPSTCPSF